MKKSKGKKKPKTKKQDIEIHDLEKLKVLRDSFRDREVIRIKKYKDWIDDLKGQVSRLQRENRRLEARISHIQFMFNKSLDDTIRLD